MWHAICEWLKLEHNNPNSSRLDGLTVDRDGGVDSGPRSDIVLNLPYYFAYIQKIFRCGVILIARAPRSHLESRELGWR